MNTNTLSHMLKTFRLVVLSIIMACIGNSSSSSNQNLDRSSPMIGGGNINEKERFYGKMKPTDVEASSATTSLPTSDSGRTNFNPKNTPAHLLHALAGLDRYPNYLSRWNYDLDDVDRLESALEEQLQKVRQQKEQIRLQNSRIENLRVKARDAMKSKHGAETNDDDFDIFSMPTTWNTIREKVIDPRAAKAIFGSKQFRKRPSSSSPSTSRPSVEDVLSGRVTVELDPAQLEDWLSEEFFDVYSFPIFSKSFCIKVKEALKSIIEESKRDEMQMEGFGRRPTDLDSIGLTWVNNLLFHLVIRPLSKQLFAQTEQFDDLDWRQGYIAGYSHKPSQDKGAQRQRLVPHTDDSEVTLNVGLGDEDFQGGDLVFWNLRGIPEEGNYVGEFHPQMGHALIHSGRHLHEVTEVVKGDRYAFIIWARSWGDLRAKSCPCCWMMRRQNMDGGQNSAVRHRCISAPQWN